MKTLLFVAACLACLVLVGCGGGDHGQPITAEDLACQLRDAGKWELWVIQAGESCPTPLASRTAASPLKKDVDTWFLAKICAADGRPAYLLDFRCLPCPGEFCLKGQIDQEEPTSAGTFQFKYMNGAYPFRFGCAPAEWETTRGVRLTICDVEVCIGEPFTFCTR